MSYYRKDWRGIVSVIFKKNWQGIVSVILKEGLAGHSQCHTKKKDW